MYESWCVEINPLRSFVSNILSNIISFILLHYLSLHYNKQFITYCVLSFTSNNKQQQQQQQQQPTNQPIREQFHSIYNEGFIVPLFSFSIKLINSRSRFHSHSIHIYLYAEFVLCRVSISNRFRTQISFPLFTITFLHSLLCWSCGARSLSFSLYWFLSKIGVRWSDIQASKLSRLSTMPNSVVKETLFNLDIFNYYSYQQIINILWLRI